MFGITSAAEALQALKTATWIGTGVCGLVALCMVVLLFADFKNKTKAQKVEGFQNVLMPLLLIGIFWCIFFIWGESISFGYQ